MNLAIPSERMSGVRTDRYQGGSWGLGNQQRKFWDSLSGLKLAKDLIQGRCAKKASELLILTRDQVGWEWW
jgi:hypothetical protein